MLLLFWGASHRTVLAQEVKDEEPAAEPKKIEAKEDVIQINFPELDLESVLKNFSEITKKTFILDQMPKGQIQTIGPIGPVEIPKDQAFNLFVLIMSLNGYNVVETSIPGVYKVVRSAEALKENIPIYGPGRRPAVSEAMVTRFVPLKYLSAQEISTQLGQLSSKDGGQVIPYTPTNMLIIVDTALNIERMLKILRLLDVPGLEPEIEIVILKYALPNEISGILTQIFQGTSATPAPRTATTQQTARSRRSRRAPPQPSPATVGTPAAGTPESEIKVIPVERINGLILIADPDTIDSMKDLIAKLDVDMGSTGTIHVYYVQNAEASELAATLSGLTGRSTGIGSAAAALGAERPAGAEAAARPGRRAALRTAQPQAQSGVVPGVLGDEISITSDEATNSLIIVASPQDYEILKKVIEKLDIPRRQVFVEAVLLEVTYNESREWGASSHGASPLAEDGVLLAGAGFSDVNSISILSALSSGSFALPNGMTLGALGQPIELGDTGVVIPSAGLVVRMLASESNVNVLSTPTLLTTDNEEASIEVGQKIPVPTGQTVSTGGFSNISISRESVGIKLKITPQINESDNIRLEIFTEVSGAVSSALGIDVNTLGVTTSIKTAETTVIVKDCQTIVIGGLMEDRQDASSSRVPLLGDIPVLGWLFKSARQGKNKTNLIILLTPHIVKSDEDVDRVKSHLREGYKGIMEEELGQEEPPWDKYFESQLLEDGGTVIDLRSGEPEVIESPDWEWTPVEPPLPEEGATAEPQPEIEPGETAEPEPEIEPEETGLPLPPAVEPGLPPEEEP